ncbi:hypothetical protein CWE09_04790 [Aliidiomarina minuta]|uniref:Sensor domain-containing diguanylate cyclase n=1 Tax=Aliidiomarina minuta TaxID=880057 RepID=A0A432W7J4_9GAMM|nr:diguanylate cyclase [Aliidiomarina minuta]RUO26047.1 hypothetical protein CWE09_04790 [Aliidiomarina minuta]
MSKQSSYEMLTSMVWQLQSTLDHVGAYVFTKDLEGQYTYVNSMVCELFDLPAEAIIGKTDDSFFDMDESQQLIENDQRVIQQGINIEGEERHVLQGSGRIRYYWSVKVPLRNPGGKIVGMCGISTDITERRAMEKQMREQKELLDTVLNNADANIFMKNHQSRYLYANQNTAQLFGLSQQELIGKTDFELMPAEQAEKFVQYDRQVLNSGEKTKTEETVIGHDGVTRHYWTIKIPLKKEIEEPAFIGIATDISDLVELREKFKLLAHTDALTGIYNRRFLFENAERELKRAKRTKKSFSVIIIDIDHFKKFNDSFGHAQGDSVIKSVVEACQQVVRETDLLGRIGGDEFVIVTPECGSHAALKVIHRLQEKINSLQFNWAEGKSLKLTLSIGLAVYNGTETFDQILARADRALYKVKKNNRNGVEMAE